MEEKSEKNKRLSALLWTARICSIPIILFTLMFVIGSISNLIRFGKADPYAVEDYPFIENFPPYFILLAVIGLIIAWKWEKMGSIINLIFLLAALITIIIQWAAFDLRSGVPILILIAVALPGVLFLIHSQKTKS